MVYVEVSVSNSPYVRNSCVVDCMVNHTEISINKLYDAKSSLKSCHSAD